MGQICSKVSESVTKTLVPSDDRRGPEWCAGDPTVLCNVSCDCQKCSIASSQGKKACRRTCNKCPGRCHKGYMGSHTICECGVHHGGASKSHCLALFSPDIVNKIVYTAKQTAQLLITPFEDEPTSVFICNRLQVFSTLIYATLSKAIYESVDGIRALSQPTFSLKAMNFTHTAVRIGLFHHATTDNYIVAIRGTDFGNFLNVASNATNWTRGIAYETHGRFIKRVVRSWIQQYSITPKQLSLTGHSLGAFLVSLVQNKLFDKDTTNPDEASRPPMAIVFNGPNIHKAVNLKHYRVKGDPISLISTNTAFGMTIPHIEPPDMQFADNYHAHMIDSVIDSLMRHPQDPTPS